MEKKRQKKNLRINKYVNFFCLCSLIHAAYMPVAACLPSSSERQSVAVDKVELIPTARRNITRFSSFWPRTRKPAGSLHTISSSAFMAAICCGEGVRVGGGGLVVLFSGAGTGTGTGAGAGAGAGTGVGAGNAGAAGAAASGVGIGAETSSDATSAARVVAVCFPLPFTGEMELKPVKEGRERSGEVSSACSSLGARFSS